MPRISKYWMELDKRGCSYKAMTYLLAKMFYHSHNSRNRSFHEDPTDYTIEGLENWLLTHQKYKEIFTNWKIYGFPQHLRPSIDRKNPEMGYFWKNIQLMTWGENFEKSKTET